MQNNHNKPTPTGPDAQSGQKKGTPAARELEKDVAKLTSNTGSSKAHVDDNEPPLAGQASG